VLYLTTLLAIASFQWTSFRPLFDISLHFESATRSFAERNAQKKIEADILSTELGRLHNQPPAIKERKPHIRQSFGRYALPQGIFTTQVPSS
jgi:hypothetical protein